MSLNAYTWLSQISGLPERAFFAHGVVKYTGRRTRSRAHLRSRGYLPVDVMVNLTVGLKQEWLDSCVTYLELSGFDLYTPIPTVAAAVHEFCALRDIPSHLERCLMAALALRLVVDRLGGPFTHESWVERQQPGWVSRLPCMSAPRVVF